MAGLKLKDTNDIINVQQIGEKLWIVTFKPRDVIEMNQGQGPSVYVIAENEDEAIKKAREKLNVSISG